MFYEESKINELLNCKKCNERLDEPTILPCSANICSVCVRSIQVFDAKFECFVCSKKHQMPNEGFPFNEPLKSLLSLQPSEVYRSQDVESLKSILNEIKKKTKAISYGVNNRVDLIKENCRRLRDEVQLATEEAIEQINNFNQDLIKEIDEFEIECIDFNEIDQPSKDQFISSVNELETFYDKWSQYLNQLKINDHTVLDAIDDAEHLNKKAEKERSKLNNLIYNGRVFEFEKNKSKLSKSILGLFCKSAILTDPQMGDLMKLFGFSNTNQRWALIYRASTDGFSTAAFHSKCDNKPNTLIIIKSTNGNVFGGYTEQTWSGSGYKNDPNTFIFSFINKQNRPLMMKSHSYGIYSRNDYGPTFGDGHSIYICNNSHITNQSYSNLGLSFKHPDYAYGSNEARSFLAGSYNFLTKEIEVYTKD